MKQMKKPTFFPMVKTFGEVFQKLSRLIAVILFVGNWHKKPTPLWKGRFFKMIFERIWGQIQIPLKKVCTETAFLFSKFGLEVDQICKKPWKMRVSFTYPLFWGFFANLTDFQLEFKKNKSSLCRQFLARNSNLISDWWKYHFEKMTFP